MQANVELARLPTLNPLQVVLVISGERVPEDEQRTTDRLKAPVAFGKVVTVPDALELL
jgi:hypothetical protein